MGYKHTIRDSSLDIFSSIRPSLYIKIFGRRVWCYDVEFDIGMIVTISIYSVSIYNNRRQERARDRSEERSCPPGYMDIPPKEDVSLPR